MKKNFAIGLLLFLLCEPIGAATHSSQLKAQIIEEIIERAAGIIALSNKDFLKRNGEFKKTIERAVEATQLHEKAKEYEDSGDEILADLYRAKAAVADVQTERSKIDIESSISRAMDKQAKKRRDREQTEQAQQYIKRVQRYRWEVNRAFAAAHTLLYEAKSAQHAASGEQIKALNYKKAAELTRKSEELHSEANRHLAAGNHDLANLYQIRGFVFNSKADLQIKENNIELRRWHLNNAIFLYGLEETHHQAIGQESTAYKYSKAVELISNADYFLLQASQAEDQTTALEYERKANQKISDAQKIIKALGNTETGCMEELL